MTFWIRENKMQTLLKIIVGVYLLCVIPWIAYHVVNFTIHMPGMEFFTEGWAINKD